MINLYSKTGLGRSGHVQIKTFDPILHVSSPRMVFWRNDKMILHHFVGEAQKSSYAAQNVNILPKF